MKIGEILSKAWKIIWTHKVLWIFGILAGCAGSGNSAASNAGYSFSRGDFNQGINISWPDWLGVVIIIGGVLVVLILFVLVIFLGTIGRIALIRGAQQADRGTEKLTFGELLGGSTPYFWRVLGLILLIIVSAIVLVLVGIPLIFACGIGLILMIVGGFFLSVVAEQASIAIVVENLGIGAGLRRGWEVVRANLSTIILLWLILYVVIGFLAAIVIGIPLALLLIPVLGGLISASQEALTAGVLVSGICFVAFIPVLLLVNGILRAYISSAWTLTFLKASGKSLAPEVFEPLPSPH